MTRVLFVSHSLPPVGRPMANIGGMQRSAAELHDALRAHPGIELTPCVLRSRWSERYWRVPLFMARALATIARAASRNEVDVVLFSSLVTGTLAIPLRRRLLLRGIRSAVIVHGQDATLPSATWQRVVRQTLSAVDAVLPVSTATAAECERRGALGGKVGVVHPGFDARRFGMPAGKDGSRRALMSALGDPDRPLPADALLLCSVGRQMERKGFHWFTNEVMPRLPADVHYWLAGDGPTRDRIRSAIERHSLRGRVRLLGSVSEEHLLALYRGADLFVMPNVPVHGDMEGFGLAMLEAGACGLPVVAARLEGVADVVTEAENGHLVKAANATGFADIIERYRRDRAALRALGERAAAHTMLSFDWPVAAERYAGVLGSLEATGRVHVSSR